MLSRKNQTPDHTITRRVGAQLGNRGLRAPCVVTPETEDGVVTLTGVVQFLYQRQAALRAARSVEGVSGVIDRMKLVPPGQK